MLARKLYVVVLLVLFCFVCVLCGRANADTIAYWRFDEDSKWDTQLNDSVGGHHFDNSAYEVTTEESGLWDPVPSSGASNSRRVQFDVTGLYNDSAHVDGGAGDVWTPANGFTIEAFVRPSAVRDQTILGHCAYTAPNSGWCFQLKDSGSACFPELRIYNGSTEQTLTLDEFPMLAGNTYAVAASYDGSSQIKLYARQNTEVSDPWTSVSKDVSEFGDVASSEKPLILGAYGDPIYGTYEHFGGAMDEVRFSSGALSEAELLATPEPGTTCLAILAAVAGVFAVWRKKRQSSSPDDEE